jgi:hypothetical protein
MTRSRRYLIRAAWALGAVAAVYVVAAYLFIPALWSRYEHQPGLAARPMVTVTAQGIPGDPLNVGLVGSREDIVRAMAKAGWHPADPIMLGSSLEIGVSVILRRPYPDAPVSSLFYQGRHQDLAFEFPVDGSAAKRHHVRLWLTLPQGAEGREVWLGSASFDRGVGFSHDTGQITHHIDADLDAERAFFLDCLARAGMLSRTYRVLGIGPTLNGRNGGGDRYFTDGDVIVAVVEAEREAPMAGAHPKPPVTTSKDRIWRAVVAAGRVLSIVPPQHPDGAH